MIDFDKRALDYKLYFRNFCCMHDAPFKVEDLHADPELSGRDQGVLWQGFSKCFSTGFYRSPAKPLTKKQLPS
jgi:hypothetical protein